jgi:hypothetical protein
MGQDLIGYLLKGPYELPEDKKDEAIEHAMGILRKYTVAAAGYKADPENYVFDEEIKALLDRCAVDLEMELELVDFSDDDADEASMRGEATEAVNDLFNIWNGSNARDCICRTDPDDKKQLMFFCGDATYGDSPDGYAYTTIETCMRYGILDFFNIR